MMMWFLVLTYFTLTISASKQNSCGRPYGQQFSIQSDRIVNGYDVGYYRYPWFAALMQKKDVVCGGALIGPKLIITAAHCYKEYLSMINTTGKLEGMYTVRLGVYNVCTTENTTEEFTVEKVHLHELYPTKKPYYDICLLTLANSTDRFEPLCLPSGVINPRPKEGVVPGLGTLKFKGDMPCTVHEARLLVYPDNECRSMMQNNGVNGSEVYKAFCAGYLSGGIDTCQGDSGGPLQIFNDHGQYVLFGLVSFGFDCAEPGALGMYTDVSQYVQWIQEKSGVKDLEFLNSVNNNQQSSFEGNDHKKRKPYFQQEHHHRNPIRIIIFDRSNKHHERSHHHVKDKSKHNN